MAAPECFLHEKEEPVAVRETWRCLMKHAGSHTLTAPQLQNHLRVMAGAKFVQ